MSKYRIHEIAKEIGKTSQEIIDVLAKNNVSVKNQLSTVDDVAKKIVVESFAPKTKKPVVQQKQVNPANTRDNDTNTRNPERRPNQPNQNRNTGVGGNRDNQGSSQQDRKSVV